MISDLEKGSTTRKAIYEWAKKELEMEFVWEDQDQHRPNKPYGTIKINPGFRKIGNTDNLRPKEDGFFTLAGIREFTLSLNCYGDNALGRANFVHSSIEKPSVIDAFSVAGLVAVSAGQVVDLSRLKDTQWESRAVVEVVFRIEVQADDEIGYIEKVRIKNNMDGSTTVIEV